MPQLAASLEAEFFHHDPGEGVEVAVDRIAARKTVAMYFRMLTGLADEPPELTGVGSIVERTLAKGTANYDGRALADAFDAVGAQWGTASGRQSMLVRVVCLPEFVPRCVELVAEMLCRPTFPSEACDVAVRLAQDELRQMEDDPHDLLRVDAQRLTLGPVLGRHVGGEAETLARLTPEVIREHWRRNYHQGRLQVAAAGPLDGERFSAQVREAFRELGTAERSGRGDAEFEFRPGRNHRAKDLQQEYMCITLPGASKRDRAAAVEQVLIGVLAGGMSGRLFTEVREKQGLVYWVGAWSEHPRGRGVVYLGASTTPERCDRTFDTLIREIHRVVDDLTDEETTRARESLLAHLQTESDITSARAANLSDDLFHFSRPVGPAAKAEQIASVTTADVEAYAAGLPRETLCVATVGPRELQ
ncbi:MAG: insulinase family protein [Planctomycetota bacterium]|nr:MAG: insulinase family protein [Planctomycetota bacterium]